MTETKEVDQTSRDIPDPVNNDQTQMKDIEMVEESPKVDKKEVDEEEKAEAEAEVKAEIPENDDDEEMEALEGEDDDKKSHPSSAVVTNNDVKEVYVEGLCEKRFDENIDSSRDAVENDKDLQTVNIQTNVEDSDTDVPGPSLKSGLVSPHKAPINDEEESIKQGNEGDNGVKLDVYDSLSHESIGDETISKIYPVASPNPQSSPSALAPVKEAEAEDDVKLKGRPTDIEGINSSRLMIFDTDTSGGGDSGTREEQAAFMMEIHKFHKERSMDFRAPKFYGEPLNLLKLWRAVLKLGGYDKVTTCKYWRQVGESFRPPRTCTTISFTFRMFYEKALLEYEKYRISSDAFGLLASLAVPMDADHQAPGPGRARRDAAARAMQGWHSQRNLDNGEVSDPITKDKNSVPSNKKEKALKSLGGILKRKKTSSPDDAIKSAPMKLPNLHSDATVIDIGSPADWVKINVRATRDCYEVYALVPGLLREEVRVQSDPAGRLVISGEPEDPDNPWNVTPFKKVVSLPSRIDPHQTSAVVTLHGQLFVRVPFEHYD